MWKIRDKYPRFDLFDMINLLCRMTMISYKFIELGVAETKEAREMH